MDLQELKKDYVRKYNLFDPSEYGRIYAFVDFANVRAWAKEFWVKENKNRYTKEIDIKKLSEIISYVKPVKKFFYYGHYEYNSSVSDQNEENVRHCKSIFRIDKARKSGFTVRTKPVKEINIFDDAGKYLKTIPKCNLDVEIVMDMLRQQTNYDTIFLLSGDSDFYPLLEHLNSKRKNIIILCARNFVSKELNNKNYLYLPADPLKDFLEYIPRSS